MKTSTIVRSVLCGIYVWFGALKIFGLSPAEELATAMFARLGLPESPDMLVALGVGEVILGLLFLAPRFTRLATILFGVHMVAVCLPLLLLPSTTWMSALVPTMAGQYILKNAALIALVLTLQPQKHR